MAQDSDEALPDWVYELDQLTPTIAPTGDNVFHYLEGDSDNRQRDHMIVVNLVGRMHSQLGESSLALQMQASVEGARLGVLVQKLDPSQLQDCASALFLLGKVAGYTTVRKRLRNNRELIRALARLLPMREPLQIVDGMDKSVLSAHAARACERLATRIKPNAAAMWMEEGVLELLPPLVRCLPGEETPGAEPCPQPGDCISLLNSLWYADAACVREQHKQALEGMARSAEWVILHKLDSWINRGPALADCVTSPLCTALGGAFSEYFLGLSSAAFTKIDKQARRIKKRACSMWAREHAGNLAGALGAVGMMRKLASTGACSREQLSSMTSAAAYEEHGLREQKFGMLHPKVCAVCAVGKDEAKGGKLLACSRCKSVRYCSAACQRKHWPEHKKLCERV
eukprot:TRINITY_DN21015_c0_g1_i1.p1 TRINITY_DN21015_c0_g1~~TRINITY_DN21015_c0_g1_i1.p1  ORF type:complete len:416 (+),score=97.65 TRINITY_DN21015_c0_g1_i1:52-1248(+)